MKKCFLVVSLLSTVFLFNSCRQEGLVTGKSDFLIGGSYSKPPGILQGILKFDSENDLAGYLDYLEKKLVEPENSGSEPAEILLNEERKLGFYSLRKKLQDEFDRLNEAGFKRVEDVPDYPWLQDPLLRSVLSPDYAVIIGNDIVIYGNAVISYKIHNLDFGKLKEIASVPPDRNGTTKELADYGYAHRLIVAYAGSINASSKFHSSGPISVTHFVINGGQGCRQYNRLFYSEIRENGQAYNGPLMVRVQIDWGDQSPITNASNSHASYYFGTPGGIPHTFPGPGSYLVEASYFLGNSTQSFQVDTMTHVIPEDCQNVIYSWPAVWKYTVINGETWALSASIWKHHFPGDRRIGAQSQAWKWNSNSGNFKLKKADYLQARVEGDFTDELCQLAGNFHENDGNRDRNTIAARISTSNWKHAGHEKLFSEHLLRVNGITIQTTLKVGICPLSLIVQ